MEFRQTEGGIYEEFLDTPVSKELLSFPDVPLAERPCLGKRACSSHRFNRHGRRDNAAAREVEGSASTGPGIGLTADEAEAQRKRIPGT
jgi:hypothetical protein